MCTNSIIVLIRVNNQRCLNDSLTSCLSKRTLAAYSTKFIISFCSSHFRAIQCSISLNYPFFSFSTKAFPDSRISFRQSPGRPPLEIDHRQEIVAPRVVFAFDLSDLLIDFQRLAAVLLG